MVVGDYNSQIGQLYQTEENMFLDSIVVESKNSLYTNCNERGSQLVNCREWLSLIVLKGRITGDIPGEFTFLSYTGKSTIDLVWVDLEYIKNA